MLYVCFVVDARYSLLQCINCIGFSNFTVFTGQMKR